MEALSEGHAPHWDAELPRGDTGPAAGKAHVGRGGPGDHVLDQHPTILRRKRDPQQQVSPTSFWPDVTCPSSPVTTPLASAPCGVLGPVHRPPCWGHHPRDTLPGRGAEPRARGPSCAPNLGHTPLSRPHPLPVLRFLTCPRGNFN